MLKGEIITLAGSLNQWVLLLLLSLPVLPIKHGSLRKNGSGEPETLETRWQR